MVEISKINQVQEWNQILKSFEEYDVFSSYEWGEYKKAQGWKIERLLFCKNGKTIGACQFLYKTKFKAILGWNSGGTLFHNPKDLLGIAEAIQKYYNNNIFTHRFNLCQTSNANSLFYLSQVFAQPNNKINSPFSIIFDLSQTYKMSSNHRYYLKQSLKNNLHVEFQKVSHSSLQDFYITYNQMSTSKNLQNIQLNQNQLSLLSQSFGDNMIVGNVYCEEKPICSCIILTCNDRAFYYLASSNEMGRKFYASYLMVSELLEYLKEQNYRFFNFGGITPYNENAFGVNRFKMGFGGEIVKYLGEHELYNSSILNKLFNLFISRKKL